MDKYQKAVLYIEEGEMDKYFVLMDEIVKHFVLMDEIVKYEATSKVKSDYSLLKKEYISGKISFDYNERLIVFTKNLGKPNDENYIVEKKKYHIHYISIILILIVIVCLLYFLFRTNEGTLFLTGYKQMKLPEIPIDKVKKNSGTLNEIFTYNGNEEDIITLIYSSKTTRVLDTFNISLHEKVNVLRDAIKRNYKIRPQNIKKDYDDVKEYLAVNNKKISDTLTLAEAGLRNYNIVIYEIEFQEVEAPIIDVTTINTNKQIKEFNKKTEVAITQKAIEVFNIQEKSKKEKPEKTKIKIQSSKPYNINIRYNPKYINLIFSDVNKAILDTFLFSYDENIGNVRKVIRNKYKIRSDTEGKIDYDYTIEYLVNEYLPLPDKLTIVEAGLENYDIINYKIKYLHKVSYRFALYEDNFDIYIKNISSANPVLIFCSEWRLQKAFLEGKEQNAIHFRLYGLHRRGTYKFRLIDGDKTFEFEIIINEQVSKATHYREKFRVEFDMEDLKE